MSSNAAQPAPADQPRPIGRAFAIAWSGLLGVHVLLVLVQAVLAGQFLTGNAALRAVHRLIGDDVLPFVALAMVVAGVLVWRPGRGPRWPALAGLLLLVADVVQLWSGFASRLDLHVPLGVTIFGVSLLLLAGSRRLLATFAAARSRQRS